MRGSVWVAILTASLGWGTGGVVTRALLLMGASPFTLVTLRTTLAALALLAFLLLFQANLLPRGNLGSGGRSWRPGAVLGTTTIAAPYLFFSLAVQYVSAGFAGLTTALIPATTAVWAHFLLPDERLQVRKLAGLVVAFAGVALMMASGESGIGAGGRPVLGGSLALIGVAAAAFGGVYGKRHAPGHSVLHLVSVQLVAASLVLALTTVAFEGLMAPRLAPAGWGLIAYLALACTILPFLLFFWLLQRVSATRASLVGYVVPLVAVAAGALLLGEHVGAGIVAGGALILLGVVLVDRVEARAATPATPAT